MARRAWGDHWGPYCLSEILVRRNRGDELPRYLGWSESSRKEAKGEGPSHWAVACPIIWRPAGIRLPIPLVVRRQGSGGRRQDRRDQLQGDYRSGQVHGGLLEGSTRRGRPCLGR